MDPLLARGRNRQSAWIAWIAWVIATLLVALSGIDVLHVPVFAAGSGYLVYSATHGPSPTYTVGSALLRCVASVVISAVFALPIAFAVAFATSFTFDCQTFWCNEGESAEPVRIVVGLAAAAAFYVTSCFLQRRVWQRDRAIWLTIAVVQLAYALAVPFIPTVTS